MGLSNEQARTKSSNEFKLLVEQTGYTLLTNYETAKKKVILKCPKGHEFDITPNKFKLGSRCRACQGRCTKHAKKEFEQLVINNGYTLLTDYEHSLKKVRLRCPEGHEYNVQPNCFKRGQRCPHCLVTGYCPDKHGYFYLIRWTKDNHSFLKFGITSKPNYQTRIGQQALRTEYKPEDVFVRYYIDGSLPPKLEGIIHTNLTTGIIDRELFGDGYTETVEDNQDNIDYITDLMINYKAA